MKRNRRAIKKAGASELQVAWVPSWALLSLHSFKAKDDYMLSW